MNNTILEIKHLSKSFDGLHLFNDASWQIPKGAVSVLLGKNGSGKTTLFNMLTGYLKPDAGQIVFNQKTFNITTSPDAIARSGIGKCGSLPEQCCS